jgi:hypothetical protein
MDHAAWVPAFRRDDSDFARDEYQVVDIDALSREATFAGINRLPVQSLH